MKPFAAGQNPRSGSLPALPEEDIPVDMDTAGEQQTDQPLGGDDDPSTWSLSRLRKRKAVQSPERAQQRRKQKISTVSWLYNSF